MKSPSPWQRYQQELDAGILLKDPRQAVAMHALQRLYQELTENRGGWRWPFSRRDRQQAPQGVYLFGSVGRGKTHLMDLFYDAVPGQRKQRWHYHDFMRWLHEQLRQQQGHQDPMTAIIKALGQRIDLLCLDEFLVNDIADAMLLAGLLSHLRDNGISLVTTSNVAPHELYQDGLQRARFLPAIDWLQQHMQIVHLDGDTDFRYRKAGVSGPLQAGQALNRQKWFFPLDDNSRQCLARWFEALGGTVPEQPPVPLQLNGHWLPVIAVTESVLWTDFQALCGENRHSNDYLELATRFSTLVLSDIPLMDDRNNDAARRFITLVDVLYDRGIGLIASAEHHFSQIYRGQRLQFEFQRTASRLHEIQGMPIGPEE